MGVGQSNLYYIRMMIFHSSVAYSQDCGDLTHYLCDFLKSTNFFVALFFFFNLCNEDNSI